MDSILKPEKKPYRPSRPWRQKHPCDDCGATRYDKHSHRLCWDCAAKRDDTERAARAAETERLNTACYLCEGYPPNACSQCGQDTGIMKHIEELAERIRVLEEQNGQS